MKIKSLVLFSISIFAFAVTVSADGDHSHEKKTAGPNGGRVLTKIEPHAEFFVTAERKVQITFLDDAGKVIPPAAQVVTVTAGERSAPTTLTFTQSGDVLLSDGALPAGNRFPAVVQVKATSDAKTVVERFTVDFAKCGECGHAEYACTCAH